MSRFSRSVWVGRGAKEHGLLAQEGGAGVLHAAVGKLRDQDHVVLGEREGLSEVPGEITDALGRDLLDLRGLALRLLQPGGSCVKPRQPWRSVQAVKGPGGEGKQIGTDRKRFVKYRPSPLSSMVGLGFGRGIGNRRPACGRNQLQPEARLQAWLVKARKGHAGVHGNEQGVKVLRVVVVVVVAGDRLACRRNTGLELGLNRVLAGAQPLGRKLNVPILSAYLNNSTVYLEGADRAVAEVEQYGLYGSEGEGELLDTWSGIGVGNQCEGQVIADI
jgi:hypothetical protein